MRRDGERRELVAATLMPIRSADVINESERRVEFSSRTFRRNVARDGAAEQFQEGRRAFRQALNAAREKQNPASKGEGRATAQRLSAKTTNTEGESRVVNVRQAGASNCPGSSQSTRLQSPPASSVPWKANAMPDRAATRAGVVSATPATTRVPVAFRVMQNAASVGRIVATSAARTARPSAASVAKEGNRTPLALQPTRGAPKAKSSALMKAQGKQAAENAARNDNIERIVRVLRARLGSHHSHTVMRLDPPELGSLRLQMELRGQALGLRIDTTTELAHDLLSRDVDELRRGLEASGIQLERVEIRPPTMPVEPKEQALDQWPDARDDMHDRDQAGQSDAEHPGDWGKESHPAESVDGPIRGCEAEPTAESLVNLIA